MLSLAASDSSARAPMLHAAVVAAIVRAPRIAGWGDGGRGGGQDERHEALLGSKVYVVDCELVLGEHGPYVEVQPRAEGGRWVLRLYSSRRHLPAAVDPFDATSMSFAAVLRATGAGVEVLLDPDTPLCRRVDAATLERLRRSL